jgi:hypothetical protein
MFVSFDIELSVIIKFRSKFGSFSHKLQLLGGFLSDRNGMPYFVSFSALMLYSRIKYLMSLLS